MKEADKELQTLLKKAWCLGPHHIGPNLLLASKANKSRDSQLFSAPASEVISIGKRSGI